jgi:hypothetical protein
MRGAKEEPGLAEVKAILMKLQRLDVGAEEDPGPGNAAQPSAVIGRGQAANASLQPDIGIFDRKRTALGVSDPKASSRRPLAAYLSGAAALVAVAGILLATGVIHLPGKPKNVAAKVTTAAQQQQESEAALLADARRLINEGDITLARSRLLQGGPDRHAEAAFMLAQSYDPNYLQALPKANNLPDRVEAERWYKKWYELAAQSGLEMDSGRLQRLINAMH